MKLRAKKSRRGTVLIVVLVVVTIMSLVAYTFAELMRNEHRAAKLHGRRVQTRVLADSGLAMLQAYFMQDAALRVESGGHYDNPDQFGGVLVPSPEWADLDSPHNRGRFTVLAPAVENGVVAGVRYGLEDESSRLNVNFLLIADQQTEDGGRQLLMGLPGMTEEIADAILDWLDEDDQVREFGAEIDYYSGLEPAYAPKNGPLESIEELLLVRGVTPELLLGVDANRNHLVDQSEQGRVISTEIDNADGAMDRGWAGYLTLWSMESNLQESGEAKIDINGDDLEQLHADLSAVLDSEWVTSIIAYRQFGPSESNKQGEAAGGRNLDFKKPGTVKFSTVLDLIGAKVRAEFKGEEDPVVLRTPFSERPLAAGIYLPKLLEHVTVNANPTIPGRININQASRTVLLGIPGMDEEVVEQIISLRSPEVTEDQPHRKYETWLYTETVVGLEQMKELIPFITGGGDVHRAQIVGYFDSGGPAARIEAILDATTEFPRVVFWRELSHLGRGYPLAKLGVEVSEDE